MLKQTPFTRYNNFMLKKALKFTLGMAILFAVYYVSYLILKLTQIKLPPAILGLVIFAWLLYIGAVKEEWIKPAVDFMLKNMPILFVPFMVGIVLYKSVLSCGTCFNNSNNRRNGFVRRIWRETPAIAQNERKAP